MGRKSTVTVEDVRKAVDALERDRKAIGIVSILRVTGGSYNVVKPLLDVVLGERTAQAVGAETVDGDIISSDDGAIPRALEPTVQALIQTWRALVDAERQRADAQVRGIQESAALRVRAEQEQRAELEALLRETEAAYDDCQDENAEIRRRVVKLERQLHSQADELARVREENAELRGRLSGKVAADVKPQAPVVKPEKKKERAEKAESGGRRAPRPFSDEDRAIVVRLWNEGASIAAIGTAVGRDRGTVKNFTSRLLDSGEIQQRNAVTGQE